MAQQATAHHAMAQQAQQALAQQALAAPMPLRVPLGDRTNVTAAEGPQPKKGKKSGRKSASKELEHQHLVKALAQGLINDREQGRSAYSYCKDNCSENMRSSLERIMRKDAALEAILIARNRSDPACAAAALEALDRLIPPRDGMQAPANLATLQAEVQQSRIETSNIFDFNQLKRISESLDWNTTSRRTRDDSEDIELHDRRLPDENLKYRIFDFANHVTKYSRLSDTLRSEVMKHCATILF